MLKKKNQKKNKLFKILNMTFHKESVWRDESNIDQWPVVILPESDEDEDDSEEDALLELLLELEEPDSESLESEPSDSTSGGFSSVGLGIVFRWALNSSLWGTVKSIMLFVPHNKALFAILKDILYIFI